MADLWSIMEFLNPGLPGTQGEFRGAYFILLQAEQRLRRITAPFIPRRLKTDKSVIADLPEKIKMKVFCPLTREQATLYKAMRRDAEVHKFICAGTTEEKIDEMIGRIAPWPALRRHSNTRGPL